MAPRRGSWRSGRPHEAWHRPDHRLPPDKQFPPGTVRSPVYLRFCSNVSSMSYAVMSGCSGVTEAYPAITAS